MRKHSRKIDRTISDNATRSCQNNKIKTLHRHIHHSSIYGFWALHTGVGGRKSPPLQHPVGVGLSTEHTE